MTRTKRRRGPGEGSVYQRADGMWVGAVDLGWHGGKRRRRYIYAKTHREITRRIGKLADAARQGQISPKRVPKVSEWMRIYLTEVASTSVRPTSLHRYEQEVRLYIDPALGRIKLDRIRPQHLTTFYRLQMETLSAGSVRRLHALIRSAFTVAVQWGLIANNPTLVVPAPPLAQREVQPLTVEEVHRVLAAAQGSSLSARWLLAITLGMRQGEVLGLCWDDVDLERGVLRVRQQLQRQPGGKLSLVEPKTVRSRRTVALPPSVVAALQMLRDKETRLHAEAVTDGTDLGLFFTTRNGTPIHPRNDYRTFRELLEKAGVRQIRLHDLRHTAASLMLSQGVHSRVVMEVLGHSQISVTMNTYSHVAPEVSREAADKIEDALWPHD